MSSTGCDLQNGRIDVKAVALFQKHSLLGSLHFLHWCRGTRCQSAVCESLLGVAAVPEAGRVSSQSSLSPAQRSHSSQTETSLKSRRNFINCTRCTASTWPPLHHTGMFAWVTRLRSQRSCSKQIVLRSIAAWDPHAQDGLYGRAAVLIPARVSFAWQSRSAQSSSGTAELPRPYRPKQPCWALHGRAEAPKQLQCSYRPQVVLLTLHGRAEAPKPSGTAKLPRPYRPK